MDDLGAVPLGEPRAQRGGFGFDAAVVDQDDLEVVVSGAALDRRDAFG